MTNTPPSLDTATTAFLARNGHSDTPLHALPGDASARRYIRLVGAGLLLMDDRTDPKGFAAFIRLARHLSSLGLSAPQVFAADSGLALIEDFGTATYGALLAQGHDEAALYRLAIDGLVHLHSAPQATEVDAPAYDMYLLLAEISVFSDWFIPAFAPDLDAARFDTTFRDLWRAALAPVIQAPKALVLRDYHIDNLMLLPGRPGIKACGLLDFQDAVFGAGEYDLMSLLQDARRDLADGLETTMLDRYLSAVPASCGGKDQILQRYYLLAAQRHTRLAGQFLRLHRRDGKPGYLHFMPRVMRQMQTALHDAQLHSIAALIDSQLPGWRDAGPALSHPQG